LAYKREPSSIAISFPLNPPVDVVEAKDHDVWALINAAVSGYCNVVKDAAITPALNYLLVNLTGGRKVIESLPTPDASTLLKFDTQGRVICE